MLAASSDGPAHAGSVPRARRASVDVCPGRARCRSTVYSRSTASGWRSAGLYDPSLLAHDYRPRAERRYDAVVVDEIQDLTNAELALVLATLKEPRGFLLCGDANQIVHPNFFSWSKVKSLFYSAEKEALEAPIHVLDANYRSSQDRVRAGEHGSSR